MLRDVVLMQKQELEERLREPYVTRDVSAPAQTGDLVCVVLGPRRAGKSFYAMHRVRELGSFGYVNFDDERLVALENLDRLLAAVDEVYGKPRHLLLDEIQNVAGWELFVNRLQRRGRRLTITGSNANLLGSELATHLTGRHLPIVILPFSFAECLRAGGRELTETEKAEAFRTYVEAGGYPEPLVKMIPRREYLRTLTRATIYKDIVVRHHVRSPQGIEDLAGCLLANVGQRYSWNTLAGVAGGRSVHTVQAYLRHMEQAFLFFSVGRFSYKLKEQVKAPRKAYCIDNGLISTQAFRFSEDRGRLYENVVALTLFKKALEGDVQVYYWQGQQREEVDFVVKEGTRVASLIQVCSDPSSEKVLAREARSLLKAGEALGCKNLLLLTDSHEGEMSFSWYGLKGRVRMEPLWRWVLQGNQQP